jgi:sulfonate transport system substrate-binding protein
MKFKQILIPVSFTLSIALALAACADNNGVGKATATTPEKSSKSVAEIRIGHQKSGSLVFLKDQKFLEQELAKQKIQVKWVEFPSGPPMLEALNTGNLDFATTGEAPPVFAQAASSGLVYVAHEKASPDSEGLLIPKGSAITDPKQLKGKRIAVTKVSSAHYTLVQALKKYGIAYTDVQPIYLQPSDARAAFEQGNVDAWVVWEPYRAAAEKQLGARTLFNAKGLKPSYSFYLARKEFAAEHPELIQAVVAQVDKADQAINADLEGFGKITAKLIGLPEDIAIEGVKRRQYGASFITPDVVAEQQKVADAFYELKLIPKHVQVKDIVWQAPQSK